MNVPEGNERRSGVKFTLSLVPRCWFQMLLAKLKSSQKSDSALRFGSEMLLPARSKIMLRVCFVSSDSPRQKLHAVNLVHRRRARQVFS